VQGNSASVAPRIAANGRYVVFTSAATRPERTSADGRRHERSGAANSLPLPKVDVAGSILVALPPPRAPCSLALDVCGSAISRDLVREAT
jgi:hypothetical protein